MNPTIESIIRQLLAEGFKVERRKSDHREHEVSKKGFLTLVLKDVCGDPCFFTLDGSLYYVCR